MPPETNFLSVVYSISVSISVTLFPPLIGYAL